MHYAWRGRGRPGRRRHGQRITTSRRSRRPTAGTGCRVRERPRRRLGKVMNNPMFARFRGERRLGSPKLDDIERDRAGRLLWSRDTERTGDIRVDPPSSPPSRHAAGMTTPLVISSRSGRRSCSIREPQQQRRCRAASVLCHAPVAHLGVARSAASRTGHGCSTGYAGAPYALRFSACARSATPSPSSRQSRPGFIATRHSTPPSRCIEATEFLPPLVACVAVTPSFS